MSERPDHNKPYPDDNEHHGLPEDAPHSPNPYEEDDLAHGQDGTQPAGEIPRKRDDSEDDEQDPFEPENPK